METGDINRIKEPIILFIKNTNEYKKYTYEKERLSQFPELKKQIDEFRRHNYEIQNEEDSDVLFDKIDELENEYAEIEDNPLVNDFLQAEVDLCRLVQEFFISITEALDFDMDLR